MPNSEVGGFYLITSSARCPSALAVFKLMIYSMPPPPKLGGTPVTNIGECNDHQGRLDNSSTPFARNCEPLAL
jgi:hypothetical protein